MDNERRIQNAQGAEGEKMKKNIIAKHQFVGTWGKSTAPNGSVSTTERELHTVEIYEADFYGKGTKKYVDGYVEIQTKGGHIAPTRDTWSDGYSPMVEKWEQRIAAAKGRA